MRIEISKVRIVNEADYPDETIGPDDPDPIFEEHVDTKPIRVHNWRAMLAAMHFLIGKHYKPEEISDPFIALFCPKCGTLRGAGNCYEVLLGEHFQDAWLPGPGSRIRVIGKTPVPVRCDEPGCDGEILWPPEFVEWSPYLPKSEIAIGLKLGKGEAGSKALRRLLKSGAIIAQARNGGDPKNAKVIRIRLDNLGQSGLDYPTEWKRT